MFLHFSLCDNVLLHRDHIHSKRGLQQLPFCHHFPKFVSIDLFFIHFTEVMFKIFFLNILNLIFIKWNTLSSTVWFRALKSGIFSKRTFNSSKDFILRRLKWKMSHTKWTYSTPFRSSSWFGWFALTIWSSIWYFGISSSIYLFNLKVFEVLRISSNFGAYIQ